MNKKNTKLNKISHPGSPVPGVQCCHRLLRAAGRVHNAQNCKVKKSSEVKEGIIPQ
jgi:hypothetical protein